MGKPTRTQPRKAAVVEKPKDAGTIEVACCGCRGEGHIDYDGGILTVECGTCDGKGREFISPEEAANRENAEIIAVVNELIEAVNKREPGINSPEADKLIEGFAKKLGGYFLGLRDKVPVDEMTRYISRQARPVEAVDPAAETIFLEMLSISSAELEALLSTHITTAYTTSAQQTMALPRLSASVQLDILDDGAKKWIKRHSVERMDKIDDATRRKLAQILHEGSSQGHSVQKIARTIKAELSDMADLHKGRAFVIAQTEIAEAMSEAALQTYKRLGVPGKGWSTGGVQVCDICIDNESEGEIPIGKAFRSGHDRPPSHPRCRCDLYPSELKGKP